MSAAPAHPARPPPDRSITIPVDRRSHGAAGSSRVQLVVLAAARLRALHLDRLLTGSHAQPADQPRQSEQPRVFRTGLLSVVTLLLGFPARRRELPAVCNIRGLSGFSW